VVGRQYEAVGYVSSGMMICVGIQLVYLTKFFYWETGYLCTLDIIHDRFGPCPPRRPAAVVPRRG